MDRTSFIWVIECCLLAYDDMPKSQMLEFGAPGELADMGLKLCEFLKEKELSHVSQVSHFHAYTT